MIRHEFLSPSWIDAAREIRDSHATDERQPTLELRMNLVVSEAPFDQTTLDAHLDSTGGGLVIDIGHLENPDVTVNIAYATAKQVLVHGDGDAALQGFMTGRIRVDGDIAKLLAFQSTPVNQLQQTITLQLREITA